jgi:aryl-alcohol dehydrogenase-like predicted oxidoreductase
MKLGLGTAQFGLDYGISNEGGRVPVDEAARIIARASLAGVTVLDTAAAYDDAELRLGELLTATHPFSIVTKLPPWAGGISRSQAGAWVERAIGESLSRLRQDSVYAVLSHGADALLSPSGPAIWDALDRARAGTVAKIGASVYTSDDIDALLERYPIELLQVPVNVLDQRLVRSGHLARLRAAGVEVHARSVFLQGLLLMEPKALPASQFDGVRDVLEKFRSAAMSAGASPLQAAVAYVLGVNGIDTVIVGVTREAELVEILAAVEAIGAAGLSPSFFEPYASEDERIVNPARWTR